MNAPAAEASAGQAAAESLSTASGRRGKSFRQNIQRESESRGGGGRSGEKRGQNQPTVESDRSFFRERSPCPGIRGVSSPKGVPILHL